METTMTDPLNLLRRRVLVLAAALTLAGCAGTGAPGPSSHPHNQLSVAGSEILLNGKPFKMKGVRLSNALTTDATAEQAVRALDTFTSYGLNTVSVYLMGSRFTNTKGFRADATLDPAHAARLARIIEAADARGMVVLVGCLYWGTSTAKDGLEHWTQREANLAVRNTVRWLKERGYRNVFIDPDNEGMAAREKGWSIESMIAAGREEDPGAVLAYNSMSTPPANSHLNLHFSPKVAGKPWVESEGVPEMRHYWGPYSKREGLNTYINVGLYSEEQKRIQIHDTREIMGKYNGYVMASTWLQSTPPNYAPGGDGSPGNPGIRWWLDFMKASYPR
jgi:hypothetical protein